MPNINDIFLNNLIQFLPDAHIPKRFELASYGDPLGAKCLYQIWKDNRNKIADGVYLRPVHVGVNEVKKMADHGLVRAIDDRLELTKKGSDVLKVMVLGNDPSVFKKDDVIKNYNESMSHTQNPTTVTAHKKLAQKTEDLWWGRFDAIN